MALFLLINEGLEWVPDTYQRLFVTFPKTHLSKIWCSKVISLHMRNKYYICIVMYLLEYLKYIIWCITYTNTCYNVCMSLYKYTSTWGTYINILINVYGKTLLGKFQVQEFINKNSLDYKHTCMPVFPKGDNNFQCSDLNLWKVKNAQIKGRWVRVSPCKIPNLCL